MSEIKVNSIKGVAASSAAITVNNTDGTCTANLTNRTNKNLVINGAMLVNQRNPSSTGSGYFTLDRFSVEHNGLDEAPTQAQVDVASGTTPYTSGFRKALKITNGNQTGGAGASDYIQIMHRVEAQNMATSGWNYTSSSSFITLSFYVKSSVAQVFSGSLRSHDGTSYSYKFDTPSISADTWTKVTKIIPGNSNLTFDNDNGAGLSIYLYPYIGTTYTTANSDTETWVTGTSGNYANNMTSTWYTTNDATFEVTGLQLEVGSVATDFEHLSYADELRRCQRYFYKTYIQGITPGTASQGADITAKRNEDYNSGRTDHEFNSYYSVPMRATPTLSFYSYAGTENKFTNANVDFSGATEGTIAGTVYHGRKKLSHISMADSVGGGKFCFFHFTASAEL